MKTPTYLDTLKKTGRTQYVDEDVAKTMPAPEDFPLEFFTLGKYVSRAELEKEYADRGLVPASPVSVALYDLTEEGRELLDDKKYVAAIWDAEGPCYAAFGRWDGDRSVDVRRYDSVWFDRWWFAGVRKNSDSDTQPSSDTLNLVARIEKLEKILAYHNLRGDITK